MTSHHYSQQANHHQHQPGVHHHQQPQFYHQQQQPNGHAGIGYNGSAVKVGRAPPPATTNYANNHHHDDFASGQQQLWNYNTTNMHAPGGGVAGVGQRQANGTLPNSRPTPSVSVSKASYNGGVPESVMAPTTHYGGGGAAGGRIAQQQQPLAYHQHPQTSSSYIHNNNGNGNGHGAHLLSGQNHNARVQQKQQQVPQSMTSYGHQSNGYSHHAANGNGVGRLHQHSYQGDDDEEDEDLDDDDQLVDDYARRYTCSDTLLRRFLITVNGILGISAAVRAALTSMYLLLRYPFFALFATYLYPVCMFAGLGSSFLIAVSACLGCFAGTLLKSSTTYKAGKRLIHAQKQHALSPSSMSSLAPNFRNSKRSHYLLQCMLLMSVFLVVVTFMLDLFIAIVSYAYTLDLDVVVETAYVRLEADPRANPPWWLGPLTTMMPYFPFTVFAKRVTSSLEVNFRHDYGRLPTFTTAVDNLQLNYRCCGANSTADWFVRSSGALGDEQTSTEVVPRFPTSCCADERYLDGRRALVFPGGTCPVWPRTCAPTLEETVTSDLRTLSAVHLGLCAAHVAPLVLILILCKRK